MAGVLAATGGFLLAVLWMDLMFDSQARGRGAVLDEAVLDSITDYYRRATTDSQPMGKLIAAVMVLLLAALAGEAVLGDHPGWLIALSAVLAGVLADHILCAIGMAPFMVLWVIRSLN